MATVEYVILEPQTPGYMYSTGPTSVEGKKRSSMNAFKRGLRSKKVVLPTEDRTDFDAFRQGLVDDLRPVGVEETLLADTIAGLHWRMLRFERAEYELLTKPAEVEKEKKEGKGGEKAEEKEKSRPAAGAPSGAPKVSETPLADAIILRGKELALVLRYRGQAVRELERARRDFRLLQKERREREAAEKEYKRLAAVVGSPEWEADGKRQEVERERELHALYMEMKANGNPDAESFRPPMWTFAPDWVEPELAKEMEETIAGQVEQYEAQLLEKVKAGTMTAEQAEAAMERFLARRMEFRKGGY